MKIAVDVKRVVQEIDLDTGKTSNYLVFVIGEEEHVVPATEEQLKRAIIEANLKQDNGSPQHEVFVDPMEHLSLPENQESVVVQPPQLGAVGELPDEKQGAFVQDLLEEPLDDQQVAEAVRKTSSVFEDVSTVVTEEDLAQYQSEGASTMPTQVDVVSDGLEGAEATFAEIMEHTPRSDPEAPLSPSKQRRANIQEKHEQGRPRGHREVIAALRERAKQVPPRRLAPHEVDEMGNPTVPQTKAQPKPPPGFAQYTDPNAPAVSINTAPVPPGLAGLDDDGFEQG